MAYFSNGSEGEDYEAEYCDRCVHQEGCTVMLLHYLYNYAECNNDDSFLHVLIPRTKDGLGNEKCTLFVEAPVRMWAVYDPQGKWPISFGQTAKSAKSLASIYTTWDAMLAKGYRCIPVTVTPDESEK